MSLIPIVQKISTFQFVEPSYEEVVEAGLELLAYLKENPSNAFANNHLPLKNLYWDVIMRIARTNEFTSQKTN